MNRRDFLKFLGIGTGTLYFDVGKNLRRQKEWPLDIGAVEFQQNRLYFVEQIQNQWYWRSPPNSDPNRRVEYYIANITLGSASPDTVAGELIPRPALNDYTNIS
jgi:hypothetical protein